MHRNSFFSGNFTLDVELTEKEKAALGVIEQVIDSNDNGYLNKIINGLIEYPVHTLQKFYSISTKFKDFCRSNAEFQKAIAKDLQSFGYVNVEVKSMDGKEHLTVFDLLIAVKIFSQYYKNLPDIKKFAEARARCIHALNTSCEIGLFNALLARCDLNTTKLLSAAVSTDKKLEAIEVIVADTKRLSNLYWLMGYVQAGWILQEVSDYLSKTQGEKDRAIIFQEESIKQFLCASLLEENPTSKKIEKGITGGKAYLEDMEMKDENKSIRTWEDAKIVLNKWSGSRATYERALSAAKKEVECILNESKIEAKPK